MSHLYFRQAIITKFIPCTNHRESRVKAKAQAGSITLGWDYALNADENHHAAAMALAAKLNWPGRWIGGALPGSGYAFVFDHENWLQEGTCRCEIDEEGDEYEFDCEIHVCCDKHCKALKHPATVEELKAAVEHWQKHRYLHGCAHGH